MLWFADNAFFYMDLTLKFEDQTSKYCKARLAPQYRITETRMFKTNAEWPCGRIRPRGTSRKQADILNSVNHDVLPDKRSSQSAEGFQKSVKKSVIPLRAL